MAPRPNQSAEHSVASRWCIADGPRILCSLFCRYPRRARLRRRICLHVLNL